MLYFLEKAGTSPQRWGSAPKDPLASGGWGLRLQAPNLLLPLNLHATFKHCSYF